MSSINEYASNVIVDGWDEGYSVGAKLVCLRCVRQFAKIPKKYRGIKVQCAKHEKEMDGAWCHGCQSWRCEWCGKNLRTKLAEDDTALTKAKTKNKSP